MLQFFAPLVHAHAGSQNFSQGLHIPGLEVYLAINNEKDYSGQFVAINTSGSDQEGILVVVDAGIKKSNDAVIFSHYNDFTLIAVETPVKPCLSAGGYHIIQHHHRLPMRRPLLSLPPRAPPATISYA
ncbi:MAG: hypothetical protein FJ190_00205 [Gammaproteobacteria bacterium]|nr:hypothetical protein [Gammaproteobacteria bacterium]